MVIFVAPSWLTERRSRERSPPAAFSRRRRTRPCFSAGNAQLFRACAASARRAPRTCQDESLTFSRSRCRFSIGRKAYPFDEPRRCRFRKAYPFDEPRRCRFRLPRRGWERPRVPEWARRGGAGCPFALACTRAAKGRRSRSFPSRRPTTETVDRRAHERCHESRAPRRRDRDV
jgi:hypothetical protein